MFLGRTHFWRFSNEDLFCFALCFALYFVTCSLALKWKWSQNNFYDVLSPVCVHLNHLPSSTCRVEWITEGYRSSSRTDKFKLQQFLSFLCSGHHNQTESLNHWINLLRTNNKSPSSWSISNCKVTQPSKISHLDISLFIIFYKFYIKNAECTFVKCSLSK